MADADVSIEADSPDVEQGTEAAGEADTGHCFTQCLPVIKPGTAMNYTCFNTKNGDSALVKGMPDRKTDDKYINRERGQERFDEDGGSERMKEKKYWWMEKK